MNRSIPKFPSQPNSPKEEVVLYLLIIGTAERKENIQWVFLAKERAGAQAKS